MLCPSVIPVRACRGDSFNIHDLDAAVSVIAESTGIEHVLIARRRRSIHLAVRGASVLSPCHLLTDLRISAGRQRVRLGAIAEFNALAAGDNPRDGRSHDCLHSNRLRFILQALDGYLAGRSQREIAELLFGAPRVRQDWGSAGGHMRDRVRRAIRRGRKLMEGGYVSLLR